MSGLLPFIKAYRVLAEEMESRAIWSANPMTVEMMAEMARALNNSADRLAQIAREEATAYGRVPAIDVGTASPPLS